MPEPSDESFRADPEIRMYPGAFWRNVRMIAPYVGPLSLALLVYIWQSCDERWPHPWLRLLVGLLLVFPCVYLFFDRRHGHLICPRCQRFLDAPGYEGLRRGEYPVYLCPTCNILWRTGESAIRYTGGGWGPRESPDE